VLYPYQRAGARWLAGRDAGTQHVGLLADGMGLGKSAQSVAAADLVDAENVTVVCPAIMCAEWRETFYRFADRPREIVLAGARGVDPSYKGVLVASYERAQRDDVAQCIATRGGVLVFDEAHYLKEPDSGRTNRLLLSPVAARAQLVVCLTGTPLPNHAGELYPIMFRAGLWTGGYQNFLGRYCVIRETDHGFQVLGHRNVDELRVKLGVLMLRRMHQVTLPPAAFDDWHIEGRECFEALRSHRSTLNAAQALIDLHDVNSGNKEVATARRIIGTAKAIPVARRTARILDADRNNKAVMFCLHTDPIGILTRELGAYGVVVLSGDTPERMRKPLVDMFQADPATRVAVCQIKAAGVGVTLTAANHLVICERPWSPADEEQALHRIIRIGQTRPTFVHRATLMGSIDEAVNRVLLRKARLIAEIIH
jgi:SWI/SNF-related matrix-associated actin-dependent regulator 1 of chromatin subfamily A